MFKNSNNLPSEEGFINVTGGRIWYKIVGSGISTPILVLHGGPGIPHDYLEPLAVLAENRPVIFYDQLGCGRSDRPNSPALWHLDRFVQEIVQIRLALRLSKINLLGHSWGAMVVVDYMLTKPEGVEKMILASPSLSVTRWKEDAQSYIRNLPVEIQKVIEFHENNGTVNSDAYKDAEREYSIRHFCRIVPKPEPLLASEKSANWEIYETMWGHNEWTVTGNLKSYERIHCLAETSLPTLFTCGKYDEASPDTTAFYQKHIVGAKLKIFEKSSHVPHLEETESYLQTIELFLNCISK